MLDKPQEANYTAPSRAPEPYVSRTPAKTRSTWKPRRAHPAGVRASIAQHLLAPAAAIWHNRQIGVPSSDRLSPTTTDPLGITHLGLPRSLKRMRPLSRRLTAAPPLSRTRGAPTAWAARRRRARRRRLIACV